MVTPPAPDPAASRQIDRQPFRLVAVGVDGSDSARRALVWAAVLASATGAEVLAVHVLTYSREFTRDLSLDTMRTWRHELTSELNGTWVEPLRAAGVHFRTTLIEADSPSIGIVAVARHERANIIVLGSEGHGGTASRVLGVIRHRGSHDETQLAVVVVPASWCP